MALTPEAIKANEKLSSLTEEQLVAIATLSVNDESKVIAATVGRHHQSIEDDVASTTGLKKNDGEKSYEFLKRALTGYKEATAGIEPLKTKVAAYEAKIATLEDAVKTGKSDDVIVKELNDTKSALNSMKAQYEADKTKYAQEIADKTNGLQQFKVATKFSEALLGLKFKADYPKEVVDTMVKSAQQTVLATYKPDWVQVDGKESLVFRGADGEIARNMKNLANPYTPSELLAQHLAPILDTGRVQTGTGTTGAGTAGAGTSVLNLGSAKTQLEADKAIKAHLMAEGITVGSREFAEQQTKIRTEANVAKLPLR